MNSVRQLRKEDVDLQAGRVYWRGEFDKTGRELVTPLSPEAVQAIRSAPPVLSPWLIPAEHDPSRPVSRSVLNDWMRKVKEWAGVDVERLGFHAYKRAGIRTREFRALPAKVQEQLIPNPAKQLLHPAPWARQRNMSHPEFSVCTIREIELR
jgi:integrase